ncbi:MAG: cytochrome C biogenesis protein [Nanoarchaeota archaeon]|nr:cytochrome C biogenesis protein [Nanoarchaeota archaeon]
MITDIITSFLLGLLTPLTAVCVLPLYPGFLAYLTNQFNSKNSKSLRNYKLFGFLITLGVLIFMLLLGIIFTALLEKPLTNIIEIISPIAFGIMGLVSLTLIFNLSFSRFIPNIKTPTSNHPTLSALLYGFFFGAIVIPCNPSFIGAFFARALIVNNFVSSILNFLAFGIGMGFPLLAFSLISARWSQKIITLITIHKRKINLIAGLTMLGISIYYLFFVFKITSYVFH